MSGIASRKPIVVVRMAIEVNGSPSPITPLTQPAARNATIAVAMKTISKPARRAYWVGGVSPSETSIFSGSNFSPAFSAA